MDKKKLPKSIRKFIRQEKARIRREVLNFEEQEKLIKELYERFLKQEKPVKAEIKKDQPALKPTSPKTITKV
ncbi:hypothetical protein J7L09_02155 [bacterium]|nr:hypothetical protein [bacterium]